MSGNEHHAVVDKGLKMKIKRKNVNNKSDAKHEIVKASEKMSSNESSCSSSNGTQSDKAKQSMSGDKSPKIKTHKKEKLKEKMGKGSDVSSVSTTLDAAFSQVSLDSKPIDSSKADDPYDFCEAKDDEGIGFTFKKVKVEKNESTSFQNHVGTDTSTIGVATDPDCLGPCEPGTNVLLEGIVWQETENGVLVVNVTWRDKTYVGTLLDATKHEWAPPRFNCDSPVSDLDARTPKGRTKRGRNSNSTPVIDKSLEGRTLRKGRKGSTFTAPPSPAKSDISVASVGLKRKGRPTEMDIAVNDNAKIKRSRSCSRGAAGDGSESPVPNFIECPEPNCKKKYRHMNGLRYHQSHAHSAVGFDGDEESRDMDNTEDSMVEDLESNMGESCENSSNNLKIDLDSIEDSDGKKENADSVPIDIVNVVKPTVKTSAEMTKIDTEDSSKKDNSLSSTSANLTKPTIGSGHSFHAVIASSKVQSSDVTMSSNSTSVLQTQTMNPNVISVTPISSSPLQSTRPITFAAITTGTSSQSNELLSGKTEKLIKPKVMNRPIAPSNMIALNTNVTVTHTNLAPVTTHISSTTQFQPIQPKPTVLGDSSSVNQHLLSEFKEKKKHKRKSKDKEGNINSSSQSVNIAAAKLIKPDAKKTEPSSVIKVAPMIAKPLDQIKKEVLPINRPLELDKGGPVIDKSSYPPNVGVITGQVQAQSKVVDLSHPPRCEASVLKVTPTLQVVTNESNRSNINDDVQSPAYSDISDANEAGSPAQSASPQIIDDKNIKSKDSQGAPPGVSLDNPPHNQYGMYGNYYNPSSYLLSPAAQGSPGSNIQKIQQNTNVPMNTNNPMNKDRIAPLEQLKGSVENKSKVDESKLEKSGDTVGEKGDRSQHLSQQELQQLQHQQWVNQQMYALQSLPPQQQYHYMAAYGPYLNRDYHMQMMASDPMYRQHFEKMIEEQQKRMHPEGIPKDLESPRSVSRSSATDISVASGVLGDANKNKPQNLSIDYTYPNKDGDKRILENSDKDQKDKAIRDKQQNDNRQSHSKESIDVKPFDKNRLDLLKEGKITEEQARRMQMYKEQKTMEQQKRVEQKKGGDNRFDSRGVDLVCNKSGKSSPFLSEKPKDSGFVPIVNIKQEPGCNKLKDTNRSDSLPNLNMSSKSAIEERNKTPSSEKVKNSDEKSSDKSEKLKNYEASYDKQRNSDTRSPMDKNRVGGVETPKSKLGQYSKPSSPHTPSSSLSQPVSTGSHYSPYLYHSQFAQSPPSSYGHAFDPYRGIVYPSNYIHPSQLGYPDSEKQKMVPASKAGPGEIELKKSEPIVQGNSSAGHKIHELQEKGRPGSRSASPVTSKSDKPIIGDRGREGGSPPTQRHVHTHHHTHVLEAAYPVYHYPSIYPAQTQVPPGAPIQHPPFTPP